MSAALSRRRPVLLWILPIALLSSGMSGAGGSVPLRLQGATFDPVKTPPGRVIPQAGLVKATPAPRQSDYYIVQFHGPITEQAKKAVTDQGAELLDYLPEFAFVARMDAALEGAIAALPAVRWVGLYQPAFRLRQDLYAKHVRGAGVTPEQALELDLLVFRGEDVRGVANAVRAVGGEVRGISETRWRGKIRAVLNSGRLTALANIPGISWIETAPDWRLHNAVATTGPLMDVQDAWQVGHTGSTQTIAIADTQLDTGDSSTYVEDFNGCTGSTPRVTISRLGSAASDTSGHGTHVAGSALGNGRLDGGTCGDYAGHPAGAAPEALGYFQAVMNTDDSLDGIPMDLNDLFQPAHDFGARIHTNSWGAAVMGAYTGNSQEADQFSWDNKDMLIFYSAGNSGRDIDADGVIDTGSIGAPATAKNVMTVGASENLRPSDNTWGGWDLPVAPIAGDEYADNENGLAPFSSRGPTDDGRTKPDIVAPGIWIESNCSTQSGTCGGHYAWKGGTSMATPLTAGAAALAREAYTALKGTEPSGAMLKALLANGATDMAPGQYGTGAAQEIPHPRPTMQAGWGRVDLADSVFPAHDVAWWDDTKGLATSQSLTYEFDVTSSSTPLKATLAWTDWPGHPAAAGGLVNDLDLRLDGPGGTHYPDNPGRRAISELLDPAPGWSGGFPVADGEKNATLLTPGFFPASPHSAKVWFWNPPGPPDPPTASAGSVTMDLVLYDNDGPGGGPGTVLCTVPGVRGAWGGSPGVYPVIVSLESCPDITSSTGNFFLSVEFTTEPTDGNIRFLYSDSGTSVSWFDLGGGWVVDDDFVYSFAAVVYQDVSPATPFDRVNNLVGIDLEEPPKGTYTLTVNGYNVAQGTRQPFGLALSGKFGDAGSLLDADLAVSKTNDDDFARIGGDTAYTVVVTNNGPDAVTGASVTDQLPGELACEWTCAAGGGATCTAGPVSGDIVDTVDLPAGATATYSLACGISGDASGTLANTASVAEPDGVLDPDLVNNTVTDSEPLTTCGEANHVVLGGPAVNEALTVTACLTLHAGDGFVVGPGADVALEAGESISFGAGWGVKAEGEFAARVDPALAGN